MEDSMTYPHDGATSTNTMPIQVIVPYDAKFGQRPTIVMKEAVSYIGELSNNNGEFHAVLQKQWEKGIEHLQQEYEHQSQT